MRLKSGLQTKNLAIAFLAPLLLSGIARADEGQRGFVMHVSVAGLLSPKVKSAEVISVEQGSNAERSGIEVGDMLVSVFGCEIPGCPAKKAKKYFEKDSGEVVSLSFVRSDGSQYDVELVLE